jgi:hypothetical protein
LTFAVCPGTRRTLRVSPEYSNIRDQLRHHGPEELRAVDLALREQFRARKISILYDDAYGLWTEDDQASAAAEASAMMDREEERRAQP